MAAVKKSALVVCPGRGAYTRSELGYLLRNHAGERDLLGRVDAWRARGGQRTVSELDAAERFSLATYSRGDNASLLTFACSLADFRSLDSDAIEVAAIAGNSLGWYTSLACAGVLDLDDAINLVNTMGNLTHKRRIGGQLVFPLTDEEWRPDAGRRERLDAAVADIRQRSGCELYTSVILGGIAVMAGTDAALDHLQREGPQGPGRFPMRLENHGAYHSPLMKGVRDAARELLNPGCFTSPSVPLIDGNGRIWRPGASSRRALRDYTLGTQIVETYDFSAAIRVGLRELAPDCVIVLGPGDSLGGAIGQILCEMGWLGVDSKIAFAEIQESRPFVLSMGRAEQRALAA